MKLKIALALSLAALIFLLLQFNASQPRPGRSADNPSPGPTEFVITGAKLFDGEDWRGVQQVWVKDGLIEAVGKTVAAADSVPRIDGAGHSLLPGLIDAHVHTWGAAREQLLRFGVTTALDMFSATDHLAEQRTERESLDATHKADLWSAGSLITAAGGHGTQFGIAIDTLDQPKQASEMVKQRVQQGSDFIKIVYDNGHAYGEARLPTLDPARLRAAIDAAHAMGKQAVIHVSDRAAAAEAVQLGADGLVHVFHDEVIDPARDAGWIEPLRQRHGFVIATLSVIAGLSDADAANNLLHDPALSSYLDGAQKQTLGNRFPQEMQHPDHLANAIANVRLLHQAGITVLAGSDSPNPSTAHGASLHGELSLLLQAGLNTTEALRAATAAPARQFGISDRGLIAPGLRADLLLVDGDAELDIRATRRIRTLWKNGAEVARQPPGQNVAELRAPDTLRFDFSSESAWRGESTAAHWGASSDQIMGGQSLIAIDRQAEGVAGDSGQNIGALRVSGNIVDGAPYPFASAMLFLHAQPMQPVDARHWKTLRFAARGSAREFGLLLFSGDAQSQMPHRVAFRGSRDWQTHEIDLTELQAVDFGLLKAIGFAAGMPQGEFELQIDQLVLE